MQLDTFFRNLRKFASGKKFRLNSKGAIRLQGQPDRNRHPINPVTLVARVKTEKTYKVTDSDTAGEVIGLNSQTAVQLTNAIEGWDTSSNLRRRLLKTLNLKETK